MSVWVAQIDNYLVFVEFIELLLCWIFVQIKSKYTIQANKITQEVKKTQNLKNILQYMFCYIIKATYEKVNFCYILNHCCSNKFSI